MAKERTRVVLTLTVTASETVLRPDGRAAIRLDTREAGPIAFEVDQRAIDALRKHLAAAETHLRHPATKTKN
jgi:hypothetical protein